MIKITIVMMSLLAVGPVLAATGGGRVAQCQPDATRADPRYAEACRAKGASGAALERAWAEHDRTHGVTPSCAGSGCSR